MGGVERTLAVPYKVKPFHIIIIAMQIELEPGKYVVAVSGGVDSVALLHVLHALPDTELIVAHFDHGIRSDSAQDRQFVGGLAAGYDLPFKYAEGRLGPGASEAAARRARYDFLEKVRLDHGAAAIVTAHHQDDLLETAIINLLRGTGRKGLSALSDRPDLRRPLLGAPKLDLVDFAREQGLKWREDSTNSDETYLRNYIRHNILPRFDGQSRQTFLDLLRHSSDNNRQLDEFLAEQLDSQPGGDNLDRRWFRQLPHGVALEVMAAWLRRHGVRGFDRKALERLAVAAKTGRAGQRFDVMHGTTMRVGQDSLALTRIER